MSERRKTAKYLPRCQNKKTTRRFSEKKSILRVLKNAFTQKNNTNKTYVAVEVSSYFPKTNTSRQVKFENDSDCSV